MRVVGPIEDPHGPVPSPHRRELDVVADACPAVDLDGPVDHVGRRPGDHQLRHGHRRAGCLVAVRVDLVGSKVAYLASLLDGNARLRDVLSHHALLRQRATEGRPLFRAADHELQCTLGSADRAHAVVDPPGAKALLRCREPAAPLPQQIRLGYADILEEDLAVAVLVLPPKDRERADHGHARGVGWDEHHAVPRVPGSAWVCLAHHDQQGAPRVRRATDPPLAAVDDEIVAVGLDPRLDVGRVAASDLRLRHRVRRPDLPVEQRTQPLLLLSPVPDEVQQLHVAGVWRGTVHRLRGQVEAPARDLRKPRVLQLRQPGLRGKEQVPKAPTARLGLQLVHHRRHHVVIGPGPQAVLPVGPLGWEDPFLHELDQAVEQLLRPGRWLGPSGPPPGHRTTRHVYPLAGPALHCISGIIPTGRFLSQARPPAAASPAELTLGSGKPTMLTEHTDWTVCCAPGRTGQSADR